MVKGLGFRSSGLDSLVWGLGFGVQGVRVQELGLGRLGLGFRLWGSGGLGPQVGVEVLGSRV
jgi:hypothetical protein